MPLAKTEMAETEGYLDKSLDMVEKERRQKATLSPAQIKKSILVLVH